MNKIKLLIVDDSTAVLNNMANLLAEAKKDWECLTASSVPIASSIIQRSFPDALLVDIVLENGQKGFDVVTLLTGLYGEGRKRPAVALLTPNHLSDLDEAKAKNLNLKVLFKPKRRAEHEFEQEVSYWLKDFKLI